MSFTFTGSGSPVESGAPPAGYLHVPMMGDGGNPGMWVPPALAAQYGYPQGLPPAGGGGGQPQGAPAKTLAQIQQEYLAGTLSDVAAIDALAALGYSLAQADSTMAPWKTQRLQNYGGGGLGGGLGTSSVAGFAGGGAGAGGDEFNPLSRQGFGDVFTRYLQGLQSGGSFAQPVQALAEKAGGNLQDLARAFGIGSQLDKNAPATGYERFLQQYGLGGPTRAMVGTQLQDVARLGAMAQGAGTPEEQARKNQYNVSLGSGADYETNTAQALLAAILQRTPVDLQASTTNVVGDMFRRQRASDPNTPWLQYAQQQGLF